MSPTPFIDRSSLQKFRQALSRMLQTLRLILALKGGYRPGPYTARLAFALVLSLLIHAFVLSLRFGIAGFGLPGIALPWTERRAHTSDLSVQLAPASRTRSEPAVGAKIEAVRRPATVELRVNRPPKVQPPATAPARVDPAASAAPRPVPEAPKSLPLPPVEAPKPATPPEKPALEREIAPKAQPEIIALTESKQETFSVPPPTPGVPKPEVAMTQQVEVQPPPAPEQVAPAPQPVQADEEAARRAREQEAVKAEQARRQEEARAAREALEFESLRRAERQAEETARQQAAARQRALEIEARQREEAKKLEEVARQQATAIERQRALQLEARRREEAKRLEEVARQQAAAIERQRALQLEAKRQEDAKSEEEAKVARRAMEVDALRQEVARQQATALARRRELEEKKQAEERAAKERAERLAADNAAARAPLATGEPGRSTDVTISPGNLSGRDLAAKALEQARTPGASRAAPQGSRAFPPSPPMGTDNSRRRSVLGGFERDVGLRMYVESWRWKIERYGNLNYAFRERARATENPVVTVAIRRDGSVEDVHIHRSSGQLDLDEAVRRIVELNAPYSAFPPDLARAYDVIEIRRVWLFSDTLRILEEVN